MESSFLKIALKMLLLLFVAPELLKKILYFCVSRDMAEAGLT